VKRILLKTIPDHRFPLGSPEYEANVIVYGDVITQVIRRPLDPQKGADIEEMRRGIRVMDAVEKSNGQVLELEDADWEHLKTKTLAMPWGFVDRRILQFVDDVQYAGENVTLNDTLSANGQVQEAAPVG
jgi:hypothetical protein